MPVLHDAHLGDHVGRALACLPQQKPLPVTRHIPSARRSVHKVPASEELSWRAERQRRRLGRDGDGDDADFPSVNPLEVKVLTWLRRPFIRSGVIEFPAICAPDRRTPAVGGHLISRTRAGICVDVHLKLTRFFK